MAQVSLVDDHHLFSSSLALALRARGLDVDVPTITTVSELRQRLAATRPDVLLLDRDLGPAGNGEDLIAPASTNGISVIVVAAALDEIAMGRCLATGALMCIPKTAPFPDVLDTVLAAADGTSPCSLAERERLIESWRRSESGARTLQSRFARLTHREAEVLAHLIDGHAVKAIAAHQQVSKATVRTQVQSVLLKLGVSSQLEAVALAARVAWRPPIRPPIWPPNGD